MGGLCLNIGDIINDALKYPLSNTKNLLFLGVIILIGQLFSIVTSLGIKNIVLDIILGLALLVTIFLRSGYSIRILESSINGSDTLPDLKKWKIMFMDGLKVIIVSLVYILPLIVISFIIGMIMAFMTISTGAPMKSGIFTILGAILIVGGLYLLIVYPVLYMALSNMAYHEKNISYAFKFGEIKAMISDMGWGKLIGWFICTGIIYLVMIGIGMIINSLLGLAHLRFIGLIFYSLLIIPFAMTFLFRSISLIYKSTLQVPGESEIGEDVDSNI